MSGIEIDKRGYVVGHQSKWEDLVSRFTKPVAAVTASIMLASGVGAMAEQDKTVPQNSDTLTEAGLNGIETAEDVLQKKGITNPDDSEVTPEALIKLLYGDIISSDPLNPLDYRTPIQIMRSSENATKYDVELAHCKPELKPSCFDLLLLLDNSKAFVSDGVTDFDSTMISHYLKRETVIKYGETGKGLEKINFKNGLSAIGLVNVSKDVESSLNQTIKDWQKDVPDFLDVCYENGMRVFYQNKVDPTGGTWSQYDEYGVYLYNCDKSDVKRKGKDGITKNLKMSIPTECFAIKARTLGITQDAFEAVLKQRLASDNALALSKKTKNEDRKKFYQDMASNANAGYELYLGDCEDPEKALAIIEEVKKNNKIKPFGFKNWQEVDAILVG